MDFNPHDYMDGLDAISGGPASGWVIGAVLAVAALLWWLVLEPRQH